MSKTYPNCPNRKCNNLHPEALLRPTLCTICQESQKLEKANKEALAKAQQLLKRSMSVEPSSLENLKKQRDIKDGDVLVRTNDGYLFFPRGSDFTILADLIKNVSVFCDWGGVSSLFLEGENRVYLETPRKINKTLDSAWIYSYTPIAKLKELEKMWNTACTSGFEGMIITTQKGVDDNNNSIPTDFGKHQLLITLFKNWNKPFPDYYEDTAAVLDCLLEEIPNFNCFWVIPQDPNFREMKPINVLPEKWLEQDVFLNKILE